MYVCGPTVYDSPHLGHAKSAVSFDLIRRYLKFKGNDVKLVKNYTDIDYKNPRATEVIDFIIKFVQKLIQKDYAYERNGSVYYSVKAFPNYDSILQNIKSGEVHDDDEDIDDQDIAYGISQDKNDPRDFALWKKHKDGEPYWESPWGKGRPGWHIECSAMAINILGETLDIHGGGQDLKFPHHRNEIAQSEAYTGKKFANYFMHNGFVNIDDEKMSKSLGNFFLVSEVVKKYDPLVVRLFLMSSHYRKSINYSIETITQAQKNYERLLNTIQKINDAPIFNDKTKEIDSLILKIDDAQLNIIKALDDDFDTPIAFAEIFTLFRELNRSIIEEKAKITNQFKERFFKFVNTIDIIFGIFPDLDKKLISGVSGDLDENRKLIKDLLDIIVDIRKKLRERKLYDISDEIRERLKDLNLKIEDN